MKLEEKIGMLLRDRGLFLATAESCTGGLIGHRITNVSGSSHFYLAGFIAYSNKAKESFLSVPGGLIEQFGAVSAEVARSMAEGARKASGADIAIAVTGIAGPTGGTEQKPVGTVFIALTDDEGTTVKRYLFQGDRRGVKSQTAQEALRFLHARLNARGA